nr:1600_t:CDS:10 [Entrophospora candida]CAG8554048.1 8741_t:CDS:10 [Entrophospora candida]
MLGISKEVIVVFGMRTVFNREKEDAGSNEDSGNKLFYRKPNVSPYLFEMILEYIYTGVIDLTFLQLSNILDLLLIADELLLDELIDVIEHYLLKYKSTDLEDKMAIVFQLAVKLKSCNKLQDHLLEIVSHNLSQYIESDDFLTLEHSTVEFILKCDGLNVQEVELWDFLINWGMANSSRLYDDDLDKWTIDDFEELHLQIKNLVCLIRFTAMERHEYSQNVFPYKKLLPKQLRKQLTLHFLGSGHQKTKEGSLTPLSPRALPPQPQIDSLYINNYAASLIESYIKYKENHNTKSCYMEYEWKLIYRASRDGYSAYNFHKWCDSKGRCVIVSKILDQEADIIGGYNPVGWVESNGTYSSCDNSFIFNFNEDLSIKNLSRVLPYCSSKAIYQYSGTGPSFGADDFTIGDGLKDSKCNTDFYYEDNICLDFIDVHDYEICLAQDNNSDHNNSENDSNKENLVDGFFSRGGHTNNWAVLVEYQTNTLSMYRTVKRLGIPDSNIILMLADDVACNPRNVFPATVFNNAARYLDLYGDNVEVDYRGYEVTVENFIRVLTGRVEPDTPRSKRLLSDDRSNVLVYMTGHGGNEFLKFQDAEEISSFDLAVAFEQMWEKRRYHEILFMVDTCQANTMYSQIYSSNILATGSSELGENSYSHHMDIDIGVAVIDRFTYYNLEFLEKIDMQSKATLKDLFDSYNPQLIHSTPGFRSDLFRRPLDKVLVTDFFGSVQNVELTGQKYNLSNTDDMIVANNNIDSSSSIMNNTSSTASSTSYKLKDSNNFHLFNQVFCFGYWLNGLL